MKQKMARIYLAFFLGVMMLASAWLALGADQATVVESGQSVRTKGPPSPKDLELNPMLLFRMGLQFYQRGLYGRALPYLSNFVQKFPKHSVHQRAVFMLADSHYFISKTGILTEYSLAAKAYVLGLTLYPRAPQMANAYFRLGQSYKAINKSTEALVAFRSLVGRAPDSPQAPKALFEIGAGYIAVNDPQSAIVEYSKVLRDYKGSPEELVPLPLNYCCGERESLG